MEKIETYRFTVEPFHVDFTGHLFLGVLGNHLLNAAGHHSHNRGWGIDHLNERHYTWVLSRLSIELAEMPAQYEHVEVETWVEMVRRIVGLARRMRPCLAMGQGFSSAVRT